MTLARRFLTDETGATVVEYGLIVAVLSLAVIAGFSTFADQLQSLLGNRFVTALNSH